MAQDNQTTKITEVKAFARYIHVSPRKLRLLADMIRKAPVDVALEQLKFSSKNGAIPLSKAINSAIANAAHNFNLKREDLFIKTLTIDGGPVFKRYAPRAQGRAFVERKRTSHINVVLSAFDKAANKSKNKPIRSIFAKVVGSPTGKEVKGAVNEKQSETVAGKAPAPKQAPKTQEKIKNNLVSLKRRLFNRKSGI